MRTSLCLGLLTASGLFFISSCKQDPESANGPGINFPLKGQSTPAHPAFAYVSSTTISKITYATLAVSDTDASHQTNIYTASTSSESVRAPSWSPSGGSICFLDGTGAYGISLKAIDVSVNSSGVPVGSNLRTLYTPSTSDSMILYTPRWCQDTATGKIAFTRIKVSHAEDSITSDICIISQTGGTVTVLASIKSRIVGSNAIDKRYQFPTWSPDDSKIAVNRQDSNVHLASTLMIFDASNGGALDSIGLHADSLDPVSLSWSHSGLNKLAFVEIRNGQGTANLYYCTPSTGSSPTTNSVVTTADPRWSPNNSSILIGGAKVVPMTTTVTNISSGFSPAQVDWKP